MGGVEATEFSGVGAEFLGVKAVVGGSGLSAEDSAEGRFCLILASES